MESIKEIKKIFKADEIDNTPVLREDLKGIMDPANVMMVVPKKNNVHTSLLAKGYKLTEKIPSIDIKDYKFCRVSVEYLEHLLNILKATVKEYDKVEGVSSITLGVCDGSPLIVESSYFSFILAPRSNDYPDAYNEWFDKTIFHD